MSEEGLRIMGIDPGFANLGVSKLLLDPSVGYNLVGLDFIGTQKRSKKLGLREKADEARRLEIIVERFDEIVRQWPAHVYAFEECPSPRNSSVVRKVAQAWGACFALARRLPGTIVLEYGPTDLKVCVTGDPKASKQDVIDVLEQRFPLLADYEIAKGKKEHLADAIAAALKAAQDQAVLILANALKRVNS
jgi:Holliday junction resolvasome RuvABC endonuclease subunit